MGDQTRSLLQKSEVIGKTSTLSMLLRGDINGYEHHVSMTDMGRDISRKSQIPAMHALQHILKDKIISESGLLVEPIPPINQVWILINNMDIEAGTVIGHDSH
jgi:hypothetical protein